MKNRAVIYVAVGIVCFAIFFIFWPNSVGWKSDILISSQRLLRLFSKATAVRLSAKIDLPEFIFKGVLADSWGNPLPGEAISLFFGQQLSDNCTECIGIDVVAGSATTSQGGSFQIVVPPKIGAARMKIAVAGGFTSPNWILRENKYDGNVIIRKKTSLLQGRISDALLKEVFGEQASDLQNAQLVARAGRYTGSTDKKMHYRQDYQCALSVDGSFSVVLPPGQSFDLYLLIGLDCSVPIRNSGQKNCQAFLVGRDIALVEMEKKNIVLAQVLDLEEIKRDIVKKYGTAILGDDRLAQGLPCPDKCFASGGGSVRGYFLEKSWSYRDCCEDVVAVERQYERENLRVVNETIFYRSGSRAGISTSFFYNENGRLSYQLRTRDDFSYLEIKHGEDGAVQERVVKTPGNPQNVSK